MTNHISHKVVLKKIKNIRYLTLLLFFFLKRVKLEKKNYKFKDNIIKFKTLETKSL